MQGHQKNSKNKNNVVHLSSNMVVVIIYCYIIGCKDKTTASCLNGFPEGSNLGLSYIISYLIIVMYFIVFGWFWLWYVLNDTPYNVFVSLHGD